MTEHGWRGEVPDLVPARMVNEYAYCPRLFYLEWVQQQFTDNLDTVEGRAHHQRVDRPEGRAPLPEEGELQAARSVQLSSEALGLVARIDLIEGDEGTVRPVDTKRGEPPDVPEGAWEPERVQLCVQGLLLRESGYDCRDGVLYFADARQRVTIPFDEELVQRTLDLLSELSDVAAGDVPPAPLVDSPKCPRCSLVGICLPDETNALAARSEQPVRRLIPRDPASRPLYVTEQGASLHKRAGRLEVRRKDELVDSVRLLDISQVSLFGNVFVSPQLLRQLFAREVPVCWFSYGGWFAGMATGLPSKNVELRRRQVAIAGQGGLDIARSVVEGKIRNSRTLLRRNARSDVQRELDQLRQLASQAREVDSVYSLRGVEGTAARIYFSAFTSMLAKRKQLPGMPFSLEGRNRRPPRDPVNCLLSYAYSLVTKDLTVVAHVVGFDPYVGFFHRPKFGRPALALDLAEEFRPLIAESLVLTLLNNDAVAPGDFVVRAGGVMLTKEGRRKVLRGYERRLAYELRHPKFRYTVTYRRLLEVQARILGAHVLGEVPEYEPCMTR
jgi:CRISPR-associated protein Cas1